MIACRRGQGGIRNDSYFFPCLYNVLYILSVVLVAFLIVDLNLYPRL